MKSLYCFALIFALCVSDGLAFGFLFKRNVETEPPIAPVSGAPNAEATDVPQQVTPKEVKNWFVGVDDVFRTMTNDFAKRAQQRLAQLEHSVFGSIQEEVSQFQPVISGMQNKTAKEIRKPDIYNTEDIIPLEANDLDATNVVKPFDLSSDTRVNDRIAEHQKSSGLRTVDPDAELISTNDKTPPANYYYTRNHVDVDDTPVIDLSKDTQINDRIAEQQASSGIVSVDPDAEIIEVGKNHKSISHLDNDVESSEHQLNRIDRIPAANLNRAVPRRTSGFVITEPDYELLDNGAKNSRNYYYYVPDTVQQVRVADLSRDTIVNDRIAEQQAASGVVMIDPEAELLDDRRIVAKPSRNHYRATARVHKQVPRRDLSKDTVVNDRISQQQAASGLVMIDPDAELIDTGANNLNNMYYNYVPNTIDQVDRRKRTESWNRFYQPYVAQPPQPRVVFYNW